MTNDLAINAARGAVLEVARDFEEDGVPRATRREYALMREAFLAGAAWQAEQDRLRTQHVLRMRDRNPPGEDRA